jgi:Domain of unknown function (DUF5134)
MTGQPWLTATFAVIMILTSGYCLTRLAVSWWRRRPTDRQVDGMHVLMGVAMAGMLVPRLRLPWTSGWEIIFTVGAALFAWRVARAVRGRTARSRADRGRPARSLAARSRWPSHDAQHLLSCAAMIYMLALLAPLATRAVTTSSAMAGMGGSAEPGSAVPLVLAVSLLGCVVWTADRMSSMAPVAALAAAGGGAPARPSAAPVPLSPRMSACCEIAMGVTMGYMLIVMIG